MDGMKQDETGFKHVRSLGPESRSRWKDCNERHVPDSMVPVSGSERIKHLGCRPGTWHGGSERWLSIDYVIKNVLGRVLEFELEKAQFGVQGVPENSAPAVDWAGVISVTTRRPPRY